MISFACKEIDIKDLLVCSFELNKTGYLVLLALLKEREPVTVETLCKKAHLDRTTTQKALTAVNARGLLVRRQINLPKGGYHYIYSLKDKNEIKRQMRSIIHGWTRQVEGEIDAW